MTIGWHKSKLCTNTKRERFEIQRICLGNFEHNIIKIIIFTNPEKQLMRRYWFKRCLFSSCCCCCWNFNIWDSCCRRFLCCRCESDCRSCRRFGCRRFFRSCCQFCCRGWWSACCSCLWTSRSFNSGCRRVCCCHDNAGSRLLLRYCCCSVITIKSIS